MVSIWGVLCNQLKTNASRPRQAKIETVPSMCVVTSDHVAGGKEHITAGLTTEGRKGVLCA